MGTTVGLRDGIPFPEVGTALTPLETHFAGLAEGAQNEINYLASGVAVPVSSEVERNTLYPAPVGLETVTRRDKLWQETYYAASMLNYGQAGWYPTSGRMPTWLSRPAGTQNVASGSWSDLGYNDNVLINNGGFIGRAGTLPVPMPGIWAIQYTTSFAASSGGTVRGLALTVDGVRFGTEDVLRSTGFPANSISRTLHWEGPVTTTVAFSAYHDAGGVIALGSRHMYVRYVGPI